MSSKYTKAAKGQECQIRIPGVCNHNPETTVFAHLNGAGMGMKRRDIHGAFCCSDCHNIVDGRNRSIVYSHEQLRLYHLDGVIRTQNILIDMGILIL